MGPEEADKWKKPGYKKSRETVPLRINLNFFIVWKNILILTIFKLKYFYDYIFAYSLAHVNLELQFPGVEMYSFFSKQPL